MKEYYWNTLNGTYHGLSINGHQFMCPIKNSHKIPDECEKGEEFTLKVVTDEERKGRTVYTVPKHVGEIIEVPRECIVVFY